MATSELRYRIAARTDTGRQRAHNEDAVAVLDVNRLGMAVDAAFVVADGMGGMQAGEVASREAVRVVETVLAERLTSAATNPRAALAEALRRANEAVRALGSGGAPDNEDDAPTQERDGADAGGDGVAGRMGTTCVAGVVRNGTLFLAHVGDSRAYRLRGGQLTRLTRDHSFVEERVLAGDLTPEEARRSRFRNMVTRAIGIEPEVEPDLAEEPLQAGDLLLVCTDGLTNMVGDDALAASLARLAPGSNLEPAAEALVDAANRSGGADNITVLLLRAESGVSRAASPASPAPPAANGTRRKNDMPLPAIVDIDAPSPPRRRGASPLVGFLAFLGVLALLAAAALAYSPELRAHARTVLGAREPTPVKAAVPPIPDLSHVGYGPLERFATPLARGDYLLYSPRGYLFFVGQTSGKIVGLNTRGEYINDAAVATLPFTPPPPMPAPPGRIFLSSDVQGNVYLSYTAKRIIEKRNVRGQLLHTFTGFENPEAIAVDRDGNLYVVDFNRIKVARALQPGDRGTAKATKSPPVPSTAPAAPSTPAGAR